VGADAVLTITGLQNAGSYLSATRLRGKQVIGLAGAGDAGIGTVILIGDHEYVCEDRDARRVREDPAAPVNLAGEMRATGLMAREDGHADIAGGRRGEEDEQA